jgi:uncharacterized repeat protein (TIGR03803 family)
MRLRHTIFVGLAIFSFDFVSHAQSQLQRLYTFTNVSPSISAVPSFITQGHDGNFYGTLIYLNSGGQGRFFQMTPAGTLSTFPPATLPPIDGLNPELAPTDDGGFYATTETNSPPDLGSILKLTPSGQINYVFTFSNPTDGGRPSSIRKGLDGSFYGITAGTNIFPTQRTVPYQTIFRFTPDNTLTTLYSTIGAPVFTGAPVQGPDGFLYGTTVLEVLGHATQSTYDVTSFYRISTNGDFTILYTRTNGIALGFPAPAIAGELIFGPDGFLYGAIGANTFLGWTPTLPGNIFQFTTNGTFSSLFTFNGTNGYNPKARLLAAADGNLYGTTAGGTSLKGNDNYGTIFRLSTHGALTTLVNFGGSNGIVPVSPLIEAADGNLYGTTQGSETSLGMGGTIFRIVRPTAISALSFSNGIVAITWHSFANGVYRVDYKNSLSDSIWTPLGSTVTANGPTLTVFDNALSDSQRFYRVVLLP